MSNTNAKPLSREQVEHLRASPAFITEHGKKRLFATIDALQAQVDGLLRYTEHDSNCSWWIKVGGCTCGLKALAQPEQQSNSSKERFDALAAKWKAETQMLSSSTDIAMNPAYQQIIGMGKEVIPYMLSDFLAGNRNHWFWALTAITGENPITEDIAGNIKAMAEAWIEWGKQNGYAEQPEQKEE